MWKWLKSLFGANEPASTEETKTEAETVNTQEAVATPDTSSDESSEMQSEPKEEQAVEEGEENKEQQV